MWIFIGFLVAIIIGLIVYIYYMKRDLKFLKKQMNNDLNNHRMIRVQGIDSDIEGLAMRINQLYDDLQKLRIENQKNESEIRCSIANMTHDLRTPLTSIVGYLQLIKNDRLTEDERDAYLEIVSQRTQHLQSLISSFYDLSRFGSHEFEFELKSVNLRDSLFETLALYYEDFVAQGVEPEIEVDEVSTILGDSKAVQRIFENLIVNMLKHGNQQVAIKLRESDDYIFCTFKNLAPNLTEEHILKLFNRFYTADNSRANRNTGIGLAITKTLVERMGHEIEAKLIKGYLMITIRWNKKSSLEES